MKVKTCLDCINYGGESIRDSGRVDCYRDLTNDNKIKLYIGGVMAKSWLQEKISSGTPDIAESCKFYVLNDRVESEQ
jgi:hypothetical protein